MVDEPAIRHSFVQINGSFVHLVTYGPQINGDTSKAKKYQPLFKKSPKNTRQNLQTNTEDSKNISANSTKSEEKNKLILFIPGNPGILGVYHDFLSQVYKSRPWENRTTTKTTIIAIGHNNFDHPDHVDYRTEERICIEANELNFVEREISNNHEPHHIQVQVVNKLVILHRLLELYQNHQVYFVGHSIGCYIILRLLQDRLIASLHSGSILLNPAFENLALTPKGTVINRLFNFKLDLLMRSVAYVLDNLLPKKAKLGLTKLMCSDEFVKNSSNMVIESVMQLACQTTLSALIKMAKSEFTFVKDINEESLIKPHIDKLELVFAENDHWVNEAFRSQLCDRYKLRAVTIIPAMHAFVMNHHDSMKYASLVSERLSLLINK